MKQFLMTLFSKVDDFLEEEVATHGRPVGFRIAILALLVVSIAYIIFYVIKTLGN